MKKKIIISVIVAAAVVGAGVFAAFKFGLIGGSSSSSDSDSELYASKLSDYMGDGSGYSPSVFMGVVEGQETTGITKSSDREIDELYVAVGDSVKKGDKLFSYKTDSIEEEITSYGFDIEGYQLQIDDYNRQITSLTNTLAKTSGTDERADLQSQIDALNTSVAIAKNSIDKVNSSIADDKKKIENSVVCATSDGVITKIASDDTSDTTSSDGYYITLLASDEMLVKGTINEQNVYSINVDEPVTVRSRVDETQTWSGTITKIDTGSTSSDSSDSTTVYYSDSSSSENSSTSYPFYVTLDSSDGLMMGQHLYIEVGGGEETETLDVTKGIYIYDYLLNYDDNGDAFVWSEKNGKLVKKAISVQAYDEDNGIYEVLDDGLSYDDYIVYPMEDLEEGMKVITADEGE